MSPKRGDRAAPPPGPDEWDIRFRDGESARGWEELGRQAPASTLDAWMIMRRNPAPPVQSPRHHRLRHTLATQPVGGRLLDRWQIEVTGGGRVWYLVDTAKTTIWIDLASPGHPKATD